MHWNKPQKADIKALWESLRDTGMAPSGLVVEIPEEMLRLEYYEAPGDHARVVRALRVKAAEMEFPIERWDQKPLTHVRTGQSIRGWSWDIFGISMTDPMGENSPVEYWTNSWEGEWGMVERNFISHTRRFPWIPAVVSS